MDDRRTVRKAKETMVLIPMWCIGLVCLGIGLSLAGIEQPAISLIAMGIVLMTANVWLHD